MSLFPLHIRGIPAPQGSKSVTRRGVMFEANKKTGAWREAMRRAFVAALEPYGDAWEPLDGPLEVSVTFFMPRPQRPRWPLPAVKPDADKLMRALGDALTDSGVIRDDARITTLHVRKRYATALQPPGVTIYSIRHEQPKDEVD